MNKPAQDADDIDRLSLRDGFRIIIRVSEYLRHVKFRIATKLGLLTIEQVFRLLLLPWALKIIVDNVILGKAIEADGSGFPDYIMPLVLPLRQMNPTEVMGWMLLFGVIIVALFGMTPNRATGRTATGSDTGARSGSIGTAGAILAQGQDTATQSENAANSAFSDMGGLFGLLDFKNHMRLTQSVNHTVRSQLAQHILSLPMTKLADQRIGDSSYRVLYDSTSVTGIYEALAIHLYSGVLMSSIILSILLTNYGNAPEIIIAALLLGPLTFVVTTPFAKVARRRSADSRKAGSKTTSNIEEGMSNVAAVQSLGGNQQESRRFNAASQESFKRFRIEFFVKLSLGMLAQLVFLIGQIVFFILMAGYVIDGTYTPGDYFVVHYYFFALSATFTAFGYLYTELQGFIAGMARVFHLLDTPPEKMQGGIELPKIQSGLVMKDVGFTYPDGRRALNKVNLAASLGEIIALVGPTGAGKTTLAQLTPALFQATEGTVSIDGIDLRDVSVESLRRQISYVFQETQLFSDSVFDNIRYGNKHASLDDVKAVARIAGAHDFVCALPQGYDTLLGTVTSKLSVGQKQRISIARGLLRESRILILDEPTSALDPETESYLIDALHEAAKEKLVIVVAHRLSTIAHADRIYFLKAGEILESGSHSELMAKTQGHYQQYVKLQTGTD